MQAQPTHLDQCVCWGETKITLVVKHCPSMTKLVRDEFDRIIQFAQRNTQLPNFGKVHFTGVSEAKHVSSLFTQVDAGSVQSV